MNRSQIIEKLKALGANDSDIETAIKKLSELITKKALASYLSKLDASQLAKMKSLSDDDMLIQYIKDSAGKLPPFLEQELEKAGEEVWGEYLKVIQK